MECPSCGNISMYFSDQKSVYRCVHEQCLVEGKTVEEIAERKVKHDEMLKNLWEQFNKDD